MDHEAAFLQAIIDRPADPQPRLIYADWLEEQGDVRAEFLRLQLQLAHQTPEVVAPELLQQEKKLRREVSPLFAEKLRYYSTPRPSCDLVSLVPEIAPYARTTTRLHPHSLHGFLPAQVSKIGGQFLWPLDEGWPTCPRCRCPLAPVVQLRACDFPDIEFPPGTDLFQLFWCPDEEAHDYELIPHVWWRKSSAITKWRLDVPDMSEFIHDPESYTTPDVEYIAPHPCTVFPERVVEYALGDDLHALAGPERYSEICQRIRNVDVSRIEGLSERSPRRGRQDLSAVLFHIEGHCPASKVGGRPSVVVDGRKRDHLLTLSTREFDTVSYYRWMSCEDQRRHSRAGWYDMTGEYPYDSIDPLGIQLGRTQRAHCRETSPWEIFAHIGD